MFKKISLAIIAALFLSVASPAIAAEALTLDIEKIFSNSKGSKPDWSNQNTGRSFAGNA